jgi:uncharacterized protein with HEPN domain
VKKREYRDYLQDIYDALAEVAIFIDGMTYQDFLKDKKTINAVIRSIEVIGEASKQLPKAVKDKNPSIPWKKMTGMRNKVIHEYFGVDTEIVWKTAKKQIPTLKKKIFTLLKHESL